MVWQYKNSTKFQKQTDTHDLRTRIEKTGVVLLSNYGDAMAGDDSLDRMGMELLKLATKVSWE